MGLNLPRKANSAQPKFLEEGRFQIGFGGGIGGCRGAVIKAAEDSDGRYETAEGYNREESRMGDLIPRGVVDETCVRWDGPEELA